MIQLILCIIFSLTFAPQTLTALSETDSEVDIYMYINDSTISSSGRSSMKESTSKSICYDHSLLLKEVYLENVIHTGKRIKDKSDARYTKYNFNDLACIDLISMNIIEYISDKCDYCNEDCYDLSCLAFTSVAWFNFFYMTIMKCVNNGLLYRFHKEYTRMTQSVLHYLFLIDIYIRLSYNNQRY